MLVVSKRCKLAYLHQRRNFLRGFDRGFFPTLSRADTHKMGKHSCRRVLYLFVLGLSGVFGDVYMHSPRGSNDRNCERNVNRNNGNRLFDSQNNAKGGYACPRAVGGPNGPTEVRKEKMYYYVGEKLPIEWTSQHGAGDNKNLQTEMILQYACTDTFDPLDRFLGSDKQYVATPRDGTPINGQDAATDIIPDNPTDGIPEDPRRRRFGMHETPDYYKECKGTSRNKGLFTADQKLRRRDARATRQNPNGNRNGLECPEERDYYPYWRPNPWRDIAIITSDWSPKKETFYEQQSQATAGKHMCIVGSGVAAEEDKKKRYAQGTWYNNERECLGAGMGHTWKEIQYAPGFKGNPSPKPLVVQGDYARVNHLGNAASYYDDLDKTVMHEICTDRKTARTLAPLNGGCPAGESTNTFKDSKGRIYDANFGGAVRSSYFPWTVPDTPNPNCALRLRYNISTYDYPAWENGNRYLDGTASFPDDFTGAPGLNATSNCRGQKNQNGKVCSSVLFPALPQDPYVDVGEKNEILSLAVNTNQFARTFQDRSYVFEIRQRDDPSMINPYKRIISIGVRGKRGNIVQTYPAVEYDFAPDNLILMDQDMVHPQWVGSDYNPRRGCNNGEGGPPDCLGCDPFSQQAINAGNKNSRADRSNLVFTDAVGFSAPAGLSPTNTQRLLEAKVTSAESVAKTPFTAAEVWKLAYIDQTIDGSPLNEKGLQCLTQAQLNAIKNNNRRENHPQNCAKLNAAITPYFDGKVMTVKLPAGSTSGKKYSAMSTRNNNFSNRGQQLNMCVMKNALDKTCAPEGSGHMASYRRVSKKVPSAIGPSAVSGAIIAQSNAEAVVMLSDQTIAPIEKDNDDVGDGEEEACEARILSFLMQLGLGGLIAVAAAMIAIGSLSTILIQRAYARHVRGAKHADNFLQGEVYDA